MGDKFNLLVIIKEIMKKLGDNLLVNSLFILFYFWLVCSENIYKMFIRLQFFINNFEVFRIFLFFRLIIFFMDFLEIN